MSRPGPRCTICSHPERARIEHVMAQGASRAAAVQKFRCSPDAIVRHWNNHVADHVKAATLVKALKPGVELDRLLNDENTG